MKRNINTCNKGFSLLEMTVVIIIITILASAAIPMLTRDYLVKAATKTALDISTIQEAARAYYINKRTWPGAVSGNPMGDLTGGNYLPSSWSQLSPFGDSIGYAYNIQILSNNLLKVYTFVPKAAWPLVENLLPASGVDSNIYVYSDISVPGGAENGGFGSWSALSFGIIYQAPADGIVVASVGDGADSPAIHGYTDSNPNPTTERARSAMNVSGATVSITFPVKKNDYYKVTLDNAFISGNPSIMYFLPLGP